MGRHQLLRDGRHVLRNDQAHDERALLKRHDAHSSELGLRDLAPELPLQKVPHVLAQRLLHGVRLLQHLGVGVDVEDEGDLLLGAAGVPVRAVALEAPALFAARLLEAAQGGAQPPDVADQVDAPRAEAALAALGLALAPHEVGLAGVRLALGAAGDVRARACVSGPAARAVAERPVGQRREGAARRLAHRVAAHPLDDGAQLVVAAERAAALRAQLPRLLQAHVPPAAHHLDVPLVAAGDVRRGGSRPGLPPHERARAPGLKRRPHLVVEWKAPLAQLARLAVAEVRQAAQGVALALAQPARRAPGPAGVPVADDDVAPGRGRRPLRQTPRLLRVDEPAVHLQRLGVQAHAGVLPLRLRDELAGAPLLLLARLGLFGANATDTGLRLARQGAEGPELGVEVGRVVLDGGDAVPEHDRLLLQARQVVLVLCGGEPAAVRRDAHFHHVVEGVRKVQRLPGNARAPRGDDVLLTRSAAKVQALAVGGLAPAAQGGVVLAEGVLPLHVDHGRLPVALEAQAVVAAVGHPLLPRRVAQVAGLGDAESVVFGAVRVKRHRARVGVLLPRRRRAHALLLPHLPQAVAAALGQKNGALPLRRLVLRRERHGHFALSRRYFWPFFTSRRHDVAGSKGRRRK